MNAALRKVVVRYAPSPTGELHLGGLRTALFNWLLAKQAGPQGRFLVRIEDTDRTRLVPGSAERLLGSLRRFGMTPDAPVVWQSSRRDVHESRARELVETGGAYPCFCTPERLDHVRALARKGVVTGGVPQGMAYDRRCRHLDPVEAATRIAAGEPHTIRLKAPLSGTTVVDDAVHGPVTFSNATIDDQILLKTDGFPTYHLASVVDDHDSEVTHVVRGEEWLSSTPKHIALYERFGWTPPKFAHLPLLLNKNGTKLSKRDKGASVDDVLLSNGKLLESTLINFIALLGWSPARRGEDRPEHGESEYAAIFDSTEELIAAFDLQGVGRKGAIVDPDFLRWLNGEHIRRLDREKLLEYTREQVGPHAEGWSDEYLGKVLDQVLSRVFVLEDLAHYVRPFVEEPLTRSVEDKVVAFDGNPLGKEVLSFAQKALESIESEAWDAANIKRVLSKLPAAAKAEFQLEKKPAAKHIMLPVRWATTGSLRGTKLPETLELLGQSKVLQRLG
mmetsp:Transcript_6731/g.11856  ORF Transcript_6731/g.11856 Transcript_6731/m.11856 type:complete len:504 (-) Transcript_6731:739-2250(-)